jgi:hypothetical protein
MTTPTPTAAQVAELAAYLPATLDDDELESLRALRREARKIAGNETLSIEARRVAAAWRVAANDAIHRSRLAKDEARRAAERAANPPEEYVEVETCEHGLSAWLCEGPMHYPADRPY